MLVTVKFSFTPLHNPHSLLLSQPVTFASALSIFANESSPPVGMLNLDCLLINYRLLVCFISIYQSPTEVVHLADYSRANALYFYLI
mgnify:CR=1 FL=1